MSQRLRSSACLLILVMSVQFCLVRNAVAAIVVPAEWYQPTQHFRQADDLPALTPLRHTPIRFRNLWVRWDQLIA